MTKTDIGDIHTNNSQDNEIIREILIEDSYRVNDLIDLSGRVLDIGAHIGIFSRLALTKGCEVISVEPEEKNFELLKVNAGRAKHIKKAVTSAKTAFLEVHSWRGELHKLGQKGVMVDTIHLDDLLDKHVHLLKMDIEGGEYDALMTSKRLDRVDQITMEYHLGIDRVAELILYLKTFGFVPLHIEGVEFGTLQLKR